MSSVVYSKDAWRSHAGQRATLAAREMPPRGYVYAHTVRDRLMQEKRVSFYVGVIWGVLLTLSAQELLYLACPYAH
jgi:hypothetical protein